MAVSQNIKDLAQFMFRFGSGWESAATRLTLGQQPCDANRHHTSVYPPATGWLSLRRGHADAISVPGDCVEAPLALFLALFKAAKRSVEMKHGASPIDLLFTLE
jgi:hypothetical protein